MWEGDKQLHLKMSLCMEILRYCERYCDFMSAFDPVHYAVVNTVHYSKQCTNPDPPTQSV